MLDYDLPHSPSDELIFQNLQEVSVKLKARGSQVFSKQDQLKDEKVSWVIKILHRLYPVAYFINTKLLLWLIIQKVQLSLKHGHSAHSILPFVNLGMILSYF